MEPYGTPEPARHNIPDGPYESASDARKAVRRIYEAYPQTALSIGNHRMLDEACRAAGVQIGAYDHKILLWLAGWEPETCAVVADLIRRAHQAATRGAHPARLPGPPLADDPRVATARELLAAYDAHKVPEALAGADLGDAWTLTVWTMVGHLGGALRMLLEATGHVAQGGERDE